MHYVIFKKGKEEYGKIVCPECYSIVEHSSSPDSWTSSIGLPMYEDTRKRKK
jgi:hypothetical protein